MGARALVQRDRHRMPPSHADPVQLYKGSRGLWPVSPDMLQRVREELGATAVAPTDLAAVPPPTTVTAAKPKRRRMY